MRKKDFKLYADECIEPDFVDHLREKHKFNIKSAIEEGLQGQSDEIILKRANETWRFLLTYNNKDFFFNDKLFPEDLFGIISLKFHKTDCPYYHLLRISKHYKQSLIGKKFFVSYDTISIRYKGENGKIVQKILDEEDCILCKLDARVS